MVEDQEEEEEEEIEAREGAGPELCDASPGQPWRGAWNMKALYQIRCVCVCVCVSFGEAHET